MSLKKFAPLFASGNLQLRAINILRPKKMPGSYQTGQIKIVQFVIQYL